MKIRIISIIAIVIILFLVFFYFLKSGKDNSFSYRTTPLKFGDLTSTISATGTVEPEDLIDVGAQVAGRIISFGKDSEGKSIDYGSKVDEGMVLAKIDDVLYASDVLEADAKLEEAKAFLLKTQADLEQMKAKRELADLNFVRAQRLQLTNSNSKADYDSFKSEFDVAKANLEVGKALVSQAKASVNVAEASLKRVKQNLDYCTIRSPVKGIVIDRRVNIGQTVVSSLNAPSLFLIAKDLTSMEVWVSVNEADIGQIKIGQNVTFAVDAFPNDLFTGKVSKIRMNASVNQNVVTYIVVIDTDNSSGKLLPYLTANIKFQIETRKNIFMVANTVLRWKPDSAQSSQDSDSKQNSKSHIWIFEGKEIYQLEVAAGITDGAFTEVKGENLKDGMEAIIGISANSEKNSSANSPFVPQFKMKK
ncbi:MAG: efflux RND transporter periplasmic adaptor subunit [Lentisphaerota bacterium]